MLRSPFAVIGVSASLSSPPPQSCVLQPGPWRVKEIWEWDQIDGVCVREWSVWRCTNGWICVCFHACGQCFGCWLGIKCQIWNAVSQEVTKCLCVLCWHIRCMASPLSSTLTDAACDSSPQQIKRLQCWWECIITLMHLKPHSHTGSWEHQSDDELYLHSSISLHDKSGRRPTMTTEFNGW